MANPVIMPRQGQSVESCIITEWFKAVGDDVKIGDILFSCETDKASFEVEAEFSGKMLALLSEEGDDVPCLDNVCIIGNEGEDISEFLTEEKKEETEEISQEQTIDAVEIPASKPMEGKKGMVKISPRARKAAEKQDLDLSFAEASGPNGRIIERDVLKLSSQGKKVTGAAKALYEGGIDGSGVGGAVTTHDLATKKINSAVFTAKAEYEDVKLSNVRKVIAKSMFTSLSEMAQLTLNASFNAENLLSLRGLIKEKGQTLGLNNITLNDMILFATAKTLKNHKDCNAHFLGDKIRFFNDVNMGIAVDTERGLLVPTVFKADKMSLNQFSKNAKEVITSAQEGSISPDLLTGGTFTVTNLGALGVESFTPVINPPQTCILGVCAIKDNVKIVNGQLKEYKTMGLSLTFDHRALDGAPAARFLQDLCVALENFSLILGK